MQITRGNTTYKDLTGAGSFIGAALTFSGLKNTIIIFHGVAGCNIESIHFRSDQIPDGGYVPIIPTGITESDCIHGGIDKLYKTLRDIIGQALARNKKPDAVFVVTSDATSIIGDDIQTAVKIVSEETGVSIFALDTPGFEGKINTGTDKSLALLLKEFAMPSDNKGTAGLNLIAPYNIGSKNWIYDIQEIERMLESAGVKVNTILARNTDLKSLAEFDNAQYNYILSGEEMSNFEKQSETLLLKAYDKTLPLPLGVANTEEWLLAFAKDLGEIEKAKQFLEKEQKFVAKQLRYNYNFSWMSTLMHGKYCSILAPAMFGASLARCLYWDFGIIPKVVALHCETSRAENTALKLLEPLSDLNTEILINPTYHEYIDTISRAKVDFAVGSIHDKPICFGKKIPHLSLAGHYFFNQYSFIPYPNMGIRGVLGLLTELSKVMEDAFYMKDSIAHFDYKERAENESSCSKSAE